MTRYLRLYGHFLRFSFSRAMEFRFDFLFRVVMDALWYVVQFAFFAILFRHTASLGGWSPAQARVFIASYLFIDAFHMTVFLNNVWGLPKLINAGDMDYYLLRPVSPLFFCSLRDFAANSFLNLIIAAGLVAWAVATFPDPLGAGRVALYVALLLAGAILYYVVEVVFFVPLFWLHSNNGCIDLWRALKNYSQRPHQIYAPWLRRTLLTALPFALIASVPCHALFDGMTLASFAAWALPYAGACAFMGWFWRFGLRHYASASS